MNDHPPTLVLDARPLIDGHTAALAIVSGRPYLATLLDMIRDARVGDKLTIVSTPDTADDIRTALDQHSKDEDFDVTTEIPATGDALVIETDRVYIRHLFIRAIRRGDTDFGRAVHMKIETLSDLKGVEQFLAKDAKGHRTPLLRYVYRPMSRWIAARLAHTPITPNFITLLALGTVPFIGVFIAIDDFRYHLAAAVLIQIFLVLDTVDGDLARVTRRSSNFGYWFDTTVDVMHEFTVIAAFGFGSVTATGNAWFALPAGIWLVSYAATHAHNLVQTAAGLAEDESDGVSGRSAAGRYFGVSSIVNYVRYFRWALGQGEIMRLMFVAGLLLDSLAVIVVIYAAYYFYSLVRMILSAYKRYRREEIVEMQK